MDYVLPPQHDRVRFSEIKEKLVAKQKEMDKPSKLNDVKVSDTPTQSDESSKIRMPGNIGLSGLSQPQ